MICDSAIKYYWHWTVFLIRRSTRWSPNGSQSCWRSCLIRKQARLSWKSAMTALSYWTTTLWWLRVCRFHRTRSLSRSESPPGRASWWWHRMLWTSGYSVSASGCIWSPSSVQRTSTDSCQLKVRGIRPWRGYGGKWWTVLRETHRSEK